MEKMIRVVGAVLVLAAFAGVSGCVPGNVLTMPGDLGRPGKRAADQWAAEAPPVAVLDFTFAGAPPHEIGRDYDRARSIVWKGDPGKAVSDLVAAVLNEKGVRAVRVPAGGEIPAGSVARVWGSVDRFRVETKRSGTLRMKVVLAGSVAATVHGSGGIAPAGWNSTVSSEYWMEDLLFVTPDGIRDAVNGAANAVAEETVRRLAAAGVIALPPVAPVPFPGDRPPAERGKEGK